MVLVCRGGRLTLGDTQCLRWQPGCCSSGFVQSSPGWLRPAAGAAGETLLAVPASPGTARPAPSAAAGVTARSETQEGFSFPESRQPAKNFGDVKVSTVAFPD